MTTRYFRRILALCLILIVLLPTAALATSAVSTPLVTDSAGILSESERADLENKAQAIKNDYGLEVRILTVPSMNGETDAQAFARAAYENGGYGAGGDQSGILLMLSMENRDYALIAHGEGNNVLTDYGNRAMADSFLSYFANNDWYGGFSDYLATAADDCHAYYVEGEAVDSHAPSLIGTICLAMGVIGAPLIGGSAVYVMYHSMKTARKQTNAQLYVDNKDGGLALEDKSDDYIYSQTIVTHRPKMDTHGGGGTTIGPGGFSGSSGKF
ncbi:MAG: TPM domain-containing protein [Peptococcaceae bacterium]|nr:TPM domain-containing protein [Peptococcaceae bacterium]